MEAALSLFWIAVVAVVAPLVAGLIPRRLVPEAVLLLALGVVIGPHVLGIASRGEAVDAFRELGLGMLFLLAGYEIELKELTGRGGRRALITWAACFALALALVGLLGLTGLVNAEVAVAIALVSTALGVLLPILRDNGQLATPFGATLLNHGAFGELGPVIAMAVLLGTRGALKSIVVLVLFAALAVAVTYATTRVLPGSRLHSLITAGQETTAQLTVRLVVLLLITLSLLAAAFQFDVVLGAFAAGFILRRIIPGGHQSLEHKLDGLAFGLLIPVFFVTSGMTIDPAAVAANPWGLLAFVVAILVVRGGPILLATMTQQRRDGRGPEFSRRDSVRLALYGATGLPIIVAVTSVAVSAGQMSDANSSLLVAGGAVTVLLLPMAATLLHRPEPELEEAEDA
ncbi:MAG TPA: cation:proton antiporter [Lapillicoccus sp.]|nr:cation:proton antiporter [Lapillicoccus sp.]